MQGIQRICAECGKFLAKFGALTAVTILVSACQRPAESATAVLPDATPPALCGEQGYLKTEIFGALASKIDWTAEHLECEGMPRPGGDGVRLRFAGHVQGDHKLAFIIALPGLRRGETGAEYQSKVTVIEEGVGRFFTTGEKEICWTDIVELEGEADTDSKFIVSGTLYCVAPLVEVNGDSDMTISDLRFRGTLDWDAS